MSSLTLAQMLNLIDDHALCCVALEKRDTEPLVVRMGADASIELSDGLIEPLSDEQKAQLLEWDTLRTSIEYLRGLQQFRLGLLIGATLQARERPDYRKLVFEAQDSVDAEALREAFEGVEQCPSCRRERDGYGAD